MGEKVKIVYVGEEQKMGENKVKNMCVGDREKMGEKSVCCPFLPLFLKIARRIA